MNSLLLKNWKLILIAACFALIVGAWRYDHAAQYRRGRESMAAEISGRLKDAAIEKAKQDRESSVMYQTGKAVRDIEKLCVWGNHSPTMYADYRFATIGGESVKDLINDQDWNANVFLPTVGKRGAAIIEARGLSSAASAANAACRRK